MSRELSDADVLPLLREVIEIDRRQGQTWLWLIDGGALMITSSWRNTCRIVHYTPDEANRETL